jgi:hypothetical protein
MFSSWNDRPTRELAHADPEADGEAGRQGWRRRKRAAGARPRPRRRDMPPEYWQAVLDDAAANRPPAGLSIRTQRLSEIRRSSVRNASVSRANGTRNRSSCSGRARRATDPRRSSTRSKKTVTRSGSTGCSRVSPGPARCRRRLPGSGKRSCRRFREKSEKSGLRSRQSGGKGCHPTVSEGFRTAQNGLQIPKIAEIGPRI